MTVVTPLPPEGFTLFRTGTSTVTVDGGRVDPIKANEIRFEGARRTQNYAIQSILLGWVQGSSGTGGLGTVTPDAAPGPDGISLATRWESDLGGGTTGGDTSRIRYDEVVPSIDNIGSLYMRLENLPSADIILEGANLGTVVNITNVWRRYKAPGLALAAARIGIEARGNLNGGADLSILIADRAQLNGSQIQLADDVADIPSEYIQYNTNYNANAVGVQYYSDTDLSIVDANNVITEVAGVPIADIGFLPLAADGGDKMQLADAIPADFSVLIEGTMPASITGDVALLGLADQTADILQVDSAFNIKAVDGSAALTLGTGSASTRFAVSYSRTATARAGSVDGAVTVEGSAPTAAAVGDRLELGGTNTTRQFGGKIHNMTYWDS